MLPEVYNTIAILSVLGTVSCSCSLGSSVGKLQDSKASSSKDMTGMPLLVNIDGFAGKKHSENLKTVNLFCKVFSKLYLLKLEDPKPTGVYGIIIYKSPHQATWDI